jgi:hypothetical protein
VWLIDFVKGEAEDVVLQVGADTGGVDEDRDVVGLELRGGTDARAHEDGRAAIGAGGDDDFAACLVGGFGAGCGDGEDSGGGGFRGGVMVEKNLFDCNGGFDADVGASVIFGYVVCGCASYAFVNSSGDVTTAMRCFACGEHVGMVR